MLRATRALRAVALLHVALAVGAALFWSTGNRIGGGYRLNFGEALLIVSLPALLARILSLGIAARWTRRAMARGPADRTRMLLHFGAAGVLATAALGVLFAPVVLVLYFLFFVPALTLFLPPVPLLEAALMVWLAPQALEATGIQASSPAP